LAESVGIRFEVLIAAGHPTTMPQPRDAEAKLLRQLQTFDPERPYEPAGKVCPLIFEHVTINADGDVYQCTAHGNYGVLKIGSFLGLTREEVLLRRYTHPVCNSCSWGRRPVAPMERQLLQQALATRLGEKIISRVPHLSVPVAHQPTTAEGYLISKSKVWV
jgi:hypothetical protein